MAKAKVEVKFDILKNIQTKYFNPQFASDVAKVTIEGIKKTTAVGLSPVQGVGRFVEYKAQRDGAKSNHYPISVQDEYPEKRVRPVNLRLSRAMMEALDYRMNQSKRTVTVGILSGVEEKKRAEAHNNGTLEPKVPTRQFIPYPGQDFIESIQREIIDIYRKRLNAIIEMSNKS